MYTRDHVNMPNPHVTLRRDKDKTDSESNRTRQSKDLKRGEYEDPMAQTLQKWRE